MAKKDYSPTPPEEIPTIEDDWLDFIHYAARQAFIARVEVIALKTIIEANGITVDPKKYTDALLLAQENEIDRLKLEEPTVVGILQELIYSGSSENA